MSTEAVKYAKIFKSSVQATDTKNLQEFLLLSYLHNHFKVGGKTPTESNNSAIFNLFMSLQRIRSILFNYLKNCNI